MVIGGGRVAERKALSLLSAGGDVKVISPSLTSRLKKERSKGNIKHISRHYRKTDLKSAFLVIAATGSHKSNSKIAEDAKDALLNVVDTPSLCSFIVPSTIIRGPLQIAISTSGLSPAMSKTIRKELEVLYPKSLGRYLNFLRGVREKASREIKDKKKRQRFLKSLASPEAINALRQGFTLKKALALIKPP
ncbi:MAG: bifunctional precorrin-2 dehydrogenase/sirohydrochlorin ferrochelatase [Nitrospirae bacterium]|nr:bifunctional precorrin-2 dehydrogenase/sirohydrochlorin ferrochelatase [Nitrospirota bacterium]